MDVVSLAAEFPNDNPALHCGVSWVCLDVTGAPVAVAALPLGVAALAPLDVATTAPLDVAATAPVLAPDLHSALAPDPPPEEIQIPVARISGIVGLGETPRDDSEHDLDELIAIASAAEDAEDAEDDEPIVVEDLPPLDETATLEGLHALADPFAEPIAEPVAELIAPHVAPPIAALAPSTTIAPPPSDDPWMILLSALADVAIGAGSPHVASVLPGLLLEGTLGAMPADATAALTEAGVLGGDAVTAAFVAQTRAWRGILLGTSEDFAACGSAMLDEWAADLLARLLGAPSRASSLKRELRSRGVAGFGLVEAA